MAFISLTCSAVSADCILSVLIFMGERRFAHLVDFIRRISKELCFSAGELYLIHTHTQKDIEGFRSN